MKVSDTEPQKFNIKRWETFNPEPFSGDSIVLLFWLNHKFLDIYK
jgi:hypothetical protein